MGEKVISILTAPTKIEVFRLNPETWMDMKWGEPKEVDRELAAKVSSVLLNQASYRWQNGRPIGSRCLFQAGAAYKFWKEKESVSVVMCFKCSEVIFIPGNPEDKGDPFIGSQRAALYPEVVRVTKKVFPDDKEIQALKD